MLRVSIALLVAGLALTGASFVVRATFGTPSTPAVVISGRIESCRNVSANGHTEVFVSVSGRDAPVSFLEPARHLPAVQDLCARGALVHGSARLVDGVLRFESLEDPGFDHPIFSRVQYLATQRTSRLLGMVGAVALVGVAVFAVAYAAWSLRRRSKTSTPPAA